MTVCNNKSGGPNYRVSIHGGHSGQYCCHAEDTLDQVIEAYSAANFDWVVISEHIPPQDDAFLYPDEKQAGHDARSLYRRFGDFCEHCRRLQGRSAPLKILVAMETETCGDYAGWVEHLRDKFRPDVVVGAVHHVDDIPFDYGRREYRRAVEACKGLEKLYCRYFDLQYDMLAAVKPQVVAHFDLIRIFDPRYQVTLEKPAVRKRWQRNLELVARLQLVLDYNVAALRKGAAEPYPAEVIIRAASRMGIAVAPGDDSHGVATVGAGIDPGIGLLEDAGFGTGWRRPPAIMRALEKAGLENRIGRGGQG